VTVLFPLVVNGGIGNNTGNPLYKVRAAPGEFTGEQINTGVLEGVFGVMGVTADTPGDASIQTSVCVEGIEKIAVGNKYVVWQVALIDRAGHGVVL
jgi:hypothetical protein